MKIKTSKSDRTSCDIFDNVCQDLQNWTVLSSWSFFWYWKYLSVRSKEKCIDHCDSNHYGVADKNSVSFEVLDLHYHKFYSSSYQTCFDTRDNVCLDLHNCHYSICNWYLLITNDKFNWYLLITNDKFNWYLLITNNKFNWYLLITNNKFNWYLLITNDKLKQDALVIFNIATKFCSLFSIVMKV
jgi:hypothetical protein